MFFLLRHLYRNTKKNAYRTNHFSQKENALPSFSTSAFSVLLICLLTTLAGLAQAAEPPQLVQARAALAKKNYALAARLANPLADRQLIDAQMLMGLIRETAPPGPEQDMVKARNWYAYPALKGFAPAQYALSRVLLSDKLPRAQMLPNTAFHQNILAGANDHAVAAKIWQQRAADNGHADAQYLLALANEPHDIQQALAWYEKAAAQHHPAAQNTLGVMYWEGKHVAQDIPRAVQLYRGAAKLHHPAAQFNLAALIAQGQANGTQQEMIDLLKHSAAQGFARAQLQYGRMLLYGDLVEQNERAAALYLHAAAQQHLGWAQYYYGILLQKGRGIVRNLDAATTWLTKAAEQHIAPAQYELGLIYFSGLGVVSDTQRATSLIQAAAQQGLPEAKNWLAEQANPKQAPSPSDKK